ncbi:hypothetical protein SNOG_06762 [Parastagonospora nodorum SN15]|uniref:Uncharacterized protein n=1 Tax=Phaeosphaeria nodorum (strain SN15 / ATCC MYA-4574 / FGSC 10173) TaxID=321614 RepID=Q0UNA2_PHANO|nr:hypothetical protein SNOG_06762 [Parastagonospora nodorum SN15]EAT85413.2 hypothetical protein SNOG_06762 [Parastagonospora nodorum SN15]
MGFAFWKSNKFPVEGKTVLLTGASQGMGKEIARLLSARGANLILVARTVKNLEASVEHARAHAKNPSTQRFTYIAADVSSEAENTRILEEASAWNNGRMPEIVWTVAGSSIPGLYIETSTETLRRQMELNYFAAAYLAHKTLQAWLYPSTPYSAQEKASGPEPTRQFIFTSSATAFAPCKAALRSLADGLRSEVQIYNAARRSKTNTGIQTAPFDVSIHAIFPGTILSPGFENEEKSKTPRDAGARILRPQADRICKQPQQLCRDWKRAIFMTTTNWLIALLRFGSLGSSQRNNVVIDTLGAWITAIIWLFMVPDLNSKVWGWGKKNGMPAFRKDAQ